MQNLLDRFTEALSAERGVYAELLAHSTQKQAAITQNDIAALDRIVRAEESLLLQLNHWEGLRRACVSELSARLGIPVKDISLRDFLANCPPARKEALEALHAELKALLEKQILANNTNKRLIESRLEYVHYAMETVAGGTQGSHIYGGGGHESGRPARGATIIDRKV